MFRVFKYFEGFLGDLENFVLNTVGHRRTDQMGFVFDNHALKIESGNQHTT
jgi:hypothetical protein